MKSFSITSKLAFGFGIITLITLVVGMFSIIQLQKSTELIENMFNHPYAVSNAVKDIRADIMSMHTTVGSMEEVKKLDHHIQEKFDLISERYLGPKADVQRVYELFKQTRQLRYQMIDNIDRSGVLLPTSNMGTQGQKLMESMHIEVQILENFADKKAEEFFINAQKKEKSVIVLLAIILAIFLILSLIIAIETTNSIVNPLHSLIDITKKIMDGDLNFYKQFDTDKLAKREDEIGVLFNSFRQLMSYLLLPYQEIITSNRPLAEKTDEIRRLLHSFDKYVIASKTDKDGIIIYASQAFQDASGYSEEELIGKSYNIIRHPNMSDELFNELWETIQKSKTWTGEIKNRTKDGGSFWIQANISPDIDAHGNIVGYNAINENITSAKAYEELSQTLEIRIESEVQKNKKQADYMLHQSRLAQMGEMISMIAHQWRQPLASISAISGTLCLDVMMDNYKKEFFQERLNTVGELSLHLSSTIDDFRGFFNDNKQKQTTTFKEISDGCLQIIGPTLQAKMIKINIDLDHGVMIQTYLNEVKQVMLNILKNAEEVLLEKEPRDAQIWIHGYVEDKCAVLSIEDNAGGIPEEIIQNVFDPYFSTKLEKDGTGLGLYMSKTIIQEHCKGKLRVINTERGAKFLIALPLEHTSSNTKHSSMPDKVEEKGI